MMGRKIKQMAAGDTKKESVELAYKGVLPSSADRRQSVHNFTL